MARAGGTKDLRKLTTHIHHVLLAGGKRGSLAKAQNQTPPPFLRNPARSPWMNAPQSFTTFPTFPGSLKVARQRHPTTQSHLGLVGAQDACVQTPLGQFLEHARAIHGRRVARKGAVLDVRVRRPAPHSDNPFTYLLFSDIACSLRCNPAFLPPTLEPGETLMPQGEVISRSKHTRVEHAGR